MLAPVSGAELSRSFFEHAVRPLLATTHPGLAYAAGLLGTGSDVLGYDDRRSQDHDWGCRLVLLVDAGEGGDPRLVDRVDELLERELPPRFDGRPVRFSTSRDPRVRHRVVVTTVPAFVTGVLGVDATGPLDALDWLVLTGQSVLEVTAGPVFHDGPGVLGGIRRRLAWYPHEVWLYVLASGWTRISQEMPLVGRAGEVGDDTGSRVVAARLVRALMHLGFLLDRQWAPYAKWTGVAFGRLRVAARVGPALGAALDARTWPDREAALAEAVAALAEAQSARGLPSAQEPVVPFHDRPARTVNPAIVAGLAADLTDPILRRLPVGIGSIEQWADNVDVLGVPHHRAAARATYRALLERR
jgi:Domain of unknown function (DUF4037)